MDSDRMVTWWGRTRSIFAGHTWDWIKMEIPADQSPYTYKAVHWHPPVDVWLPHYPVRRRKRVR